MQTLIAASDLIHWSCTSACRGTPLSISSVFLAAPVSVNPGPPLDGRLATRDLSYLATAIVSQSHQLGPDIGVDLRARTEDALSPMGDFSHVMTVRQLVDLHTYLLCARSDKIRPRPATELRS